MSIVQTTAVICFLSNVHRVLKNLIIVVLTAVRQSLPCPRKNKGSSEKAHTTAIKYSKKGVPIT
jgi:hypothetical protein